jgi:hypothetical protein
MLKKALQKNEQDEKEKACLRRSTRQRCSNRRLQFEEVNFSIVHLWCEAVTLCLLSKLYLYYCQKRISAFFIVLRKFILIVCKPTTCNTDDECNKIYAAGYSISFSLQLLCENVSDRPK